MDYFHFFFFFFEAGWREGLINPLIENNYVTRIFLQNFLYHLSHFSNCRVQKVFFRSQSFMENYLKVEEKFEKKTAEFF